MTDSVVEQNEIADERGSRRVSSRGIGAWFRPLPPLMRELLSDQMVEDGYELAEPPTYTVETYGGEDELHVHDETTIEGDPIAEAEWLEYQEKKVAWEIEFNQRLFKICMLRCMEPEGLDDEQWVKEQEFLGFVVPDDPIEKKIYYIKTEYIGTQEDYLSVLSVPFELSVQASEVQLAVERMFRKYRMEGQDGPEGSGSDISEEELELASEQAGRSDDISEDADSS